MGFLRDDRELVAAKKRVAKYEYWANTSEKNGQEKNAKMAKAFAESAKADLAVELAKYLKK